MLATTLSTEWARTTLISIPNQAIEFRIVSPMEPPEGWSGVWAIVHPNLISDWSFRLTLGVGRKPTGSDIPDGTYTVDLEVASESQCSVGGVISGFLTAEACEFLPQLTFHWDYDL